MLLMKCDVTHILEETRAAVRDSGLSMEQVAEHAGLSKWWVRKFMQGKIPNPGIENLVKLRNYLKTAA